MLDSESYNLPFNSGLRCSCSDEDEGVVPEQGKAIAGINKYYYHHSSFIVFIIFSFVSLLNGLKESNNKSCWQYLLTALMYIICW